MEYLTYFTIISEHITTYYNISQHITTYHNYILLYMIMSYYQPMIPNDWERICTSCTRNFRPFLGEAAHWHRWPCEGASDSPRRGRPGPHSSDFGNLRKT